MLTHSRRSLLGMGAAGCLCSVCGQKALAQSWAVTAAQGDHTSDYKSGCYLPASDFQSRDFQGKGTNFVRSSNFKVGDTSYRISASSGDRFFDRALAQALYHISELYGVTPTFGFIQGGNLANAMATTATYQPEQGDAPLPAREDGTVLMGDGILALLASKGITNPVAGALSICAHEFAHIVQYRYAYNDVHVIDILVKDQPTVKRAELHADFLAGFYIGTAKKRNPRTPAATVAQAVYSIGDFNVNDKGHHGTPEERGNAVYAGFQMSYERNVDFPTALVEGLRYVGAIT